LVFAITAKRSQVSERRRGAESQTLGSRGGIFVVITDGLGVQVEANGPDVTLEQLEALADSLLTGLP
jgi:hypothetical protein